MNSLVVRHEQEVLTLLCGDECPHYRHRSDSCPQRESKTMTAELIAGTSQLRLISLDAQRSEKLRAGIAG